MDMLCIDQGASLVSGCHESKGRLLLQQYIACKHVYVVNAKWMDL